MKKHILALTTATSLLLAPMLAIESPSASAQDRTFPEGLDIVAEFAAGHPPGNIAVTPDGRLIMSQHQFYGTDIKIVEVFEDGSVQPFPNRDWASPPDANGIGLNNVLGIRSDGQGVVWMLDNAGEHTSGRLVGWDTKGDRLHQIIYLGMPLAPANAFLNDFAIDSYNNAAYIADTAAGENSALIVVDLDTGYSRRVLEGHPSMRPEDIPMMVDGREVTLGGEGARIGVNPITIDPSNEWVYYGPMTGRSLYRVRTSHLFDPLLHPDDLANLVERFGDKPISDGITIDGGGNVYVTDITNNAIGVVDPGGTYRILYQDDDLSWTDGFGFGPDNHIYVTVNQLQRSPALNQGTDDSVPPYYLLRFPALEAGVVGR